MAAVAPVGATTAANPSTDVEYFLRVYTELPIRPSEHEEERWVWTPLLCFSATDLVDVVRIAGGRPWRWFLFACGVILGTEDGTLSTSQSADDALNLDAPDINPGISTVYFHLPLAARSCLRTVEPNLCTNKLGSATSVTERDYDDAAIGERDGHKCVCSDLPERFCRAVNLIPHVKGNTYIDNLTGGTIKNIDHERNMFLLQPSLHQGLGKDFAVMPKPNFAYPDADEAWVPHMLRSDALVLLRRPSCRVPEDTTNRWPPNLLFYHVYGAAVLHTFGGEAPVHVLAELSKVYYGPDGPMDSEQRHARTQQEEARAAEAGHAPAAAPIAAPAGGFDELAACLPLWFFALDRDTQKTWVLEARRKQESAEAARNDRIVQWQQESAGT
ncbi:hypothetical protein EXIGLDRAFT_841902 [Exidia glandulosa HHB12029]|uniref:HNH nuclease domain-containing protein n=1 Tax=Exidia glandulosa HHB12029 TaxID=1314781 RepID=A0A165DLK7_EXIGL|nr:hypothetical protein EXIGLDRAFT_841902 [Exidia glandulosa HHB12029]